MTTETRYKKIGPSKMSTTMSSIRSVLIRTCMANVQKEVSQLEHWLNNLSDDSPAHIPSHPTSNPIHTYDEHFELSSLNRVIERLTEEVSNQRHTLNNILERLDNLEGFRRPDREVFIDENHNQPSNHNDPWLDNNCEPLANELIGEEDDISEPLYTHNNKSLSAKSSVGTPSIIPDIPEDKSVIPDIDSDNEDDKVSFPPQTIHSNQSSKNVVTQDVTEHAEEEEEAEETETEETETEETETEETETETEETEEVEEEEEEEVEVEVEVETEEVVVETKEKVVEEVNVPEKSEDNEVKKEEEEQGEEEEEEEEGEEEDGQEFEEIEYKGVRYYKDNENFIYSVDEEDQPSENPVGYWKEKTQTIAFYKTK